MGLFDLFKPNAEEMKRKRNVNGLIRALKHNDWSVRAAAVRAIGELALLNLNEFELLALLSAESALVEALNDVNTEVSINASYSLQNIKERKLLSLISLIEYRLRANEYFELHTLIKSLGTFGDRDDVIMLLNRCLSDEYAHIRSSAINALGNMGSSKALEMVISIGLTDKDEDVRKAACEALEKIGTKAVTPLIDALRHKDDFVRESAAYALGQIKDNRSIEPLKTALLQDTSFSVRKAVAFSLEKIVPNDLLVRIWSICSNDKLINNEDLLVSFGNAAVDPLINYLSFEAIYKPDIIAIIALGRLKDTRAIEPLINFFLKDAKRDKYNRAAAVEALGEIGDERAIESLVNIVMTKNEDADVRRAAVLSLGAIGNSKAVDTLFAWFNDKDMGDLRYTILLSLLKLRDCRAIGELIDMMFEYEYRIPNALIDTCDILGDYNKIIVPLIADHGIDRIEIDKYRSQEHAIHGVYYGRYEHNLERLNTAIETLCKINTPIANNILHKLTQKKDIKIIVECVDAEEGYDQHVYRTLSMSPLREKAINELSRRGNPPYDPSAYLDKGAWKF